MHFAFLTFSRKQLGVVQVYKFASPWEQPFFFLLIPANPLPPQSVFPRSSSRSSNSPLCLIIS